MWTSGGIQRYKVLVKTNGYESWIVIYASNLTAAQNQVVAQYGGENVLSNPIQIEEDHIPV